MPRKAEIEGMAKGGEEGGNRPAQANAVGANRQVYGNSPTCEIPAKGLPRRILEGRGWLTHYGPMHPNKHIREALKYAEQQGWRIVKSRGHAYCRILCSH